MLKKILILSANPKDTVRLRLDKETREIKEALRRAKHRDEYEVEQVWALRIKDLRRAILDVEPHIVHFCGHGKRRGIILEDDQGNAVTVNPDALSKLFKMFSDSIECVVLNACLSEQQAKSIGQHIDYVIGMKETIADSAAIEFSQGFYDGIGAGKSIEEAFQLGCNSIQLKNLPDYTTPILIKIPARAALPSYNDSGGQLFDLLPYMPDRDEQEAHLYSILLERIQGKHLKNIVCFLHGDSLQCHEKFIERLQHHSLPKLFGQKSSQAIARDIMVNWPVSYLNSDDLINKVLIELRDYAPEHTPFEFHSIAEAINQSHTGPLIFYSYLDPGDWRKHLLPPIDEYLNFWSKWPKRSTSAPLLACLIIKYRVNLTNRSHSFLRRLLYQMQAPQKINEEIKNSLNSLNLADFPDIAGIVLPELLDVPQKDAESWTQMKPVKQICGSRYLIPEVRAIYEMNAANNDGSIPMELLADALVINILNRYLTE